MKRKFNVTAALATTAAVGLLAGPAFAQGRPDTMGAPMVCPTTQMSPGHNDCVMPTAASPGGGSFPGSFLVPGTNTSFAVHGFIEGDIVHYLGTHEYQFNEAAPVAGPGVSTTNSLNGGTSIYLNNTRPNIETHTPTAYGLLKTYTEFDFNQTSTAQLAGNNDVVRLRQAYGTLGPWLLGQTLSLFADPAAYEDGLNTNQNVGEMVPANVRRPQIRYTWLAGNGLSVAASAEMPTYPNNVGATVAANTQGVTVTGITYSSTVYYNWPRFIIAPEWDQPWGHVKLAVGAGVTDIREANTTTNTGPSRQVGDWAATLSGHINTWGKDALRGGVTYNYGAADLNSWISQGSWVENTTTGTVKIQKAISFYANYEHFFNGQWRANVNGGWMTVSGNPFTVACGTSAATTCPQASLVKKIYSTEVNVIFSPVPQTDFIFGWEHGYRKMQSGAKGTVNAIASQFKFYF